MVGLCLHVRCLVPNLCSHVFGRVLLMAERCRLNRCCCVLVAGVAMVAARGRLICLRKRQWRVLGRHMVIVRRVLAIWLCVQQVERGAQNIGFCGCQEWLGLRTDLLDKLIFRFVLVLHSWSHLCVLLCLCCRCTWKRLHDLQTSCLWIFRQVAC